MADNSDKVREAAPNFATTLDAPIAGSGDTSCTLSNTTGLSTATAVTITIDATNASGQPTPDVKETVTGVVSGTEIINLLRGQDGTTAQAHATGATVVQWFTANDWNDFADSYLEEHNQDGTHTGIQTDTLAASGNVTIAGTFGVTGATTLTGATAVNGVLSPNAGLANASVTYGALLTTIFGGQVLTYTPTVGALSNCTLNAAAGSYINLGGIKLCWITVSTSHTSTNAHVAGLTLPPTFFTTVTTYMPTIEAVGGSAFQTVTGDAVTGVASLAYYMANTSNGALQVTSILVIGT